MVAKALEFLQASLPLLLPLCPPAQCQHGGAKVRPGFSEAVLPTLYFEALMGRFLSLLHVVGDTCQGFGSTTTSTLTQVADCQKSSGLFSSVCLNSHQLGVGCMGGHLLSIP